MTDSLEQGASHDEPTKANLKQSHFRESRRKLAVGLVLLLVLGFLSVAFAVDRSAHKDRVARNVTVAGVDAGGLTASALASRIETIAGEYESTSLVLGDEHSTFTVPARSVQLAFDRQSTIENTMEAGNAGNLAVEFARWVRGFVDPTEAHTDISVNSDLYRDAIFRGDQGPRSNPVEPTFAIQDGKLTGVEGAKGRGIDARDAEKRLYDSANNGMPLKLRVERKPIEPRYTLDQAQALAAQVETEVLRDLPVSAGKSQRTFDANTMRPWVTTQSGVSKLELGVDTDKVSKDLEALLPDAGEKPREPAWNIIDDKPVISPGADGTTCCEKVAAETIGKTLQERLQNSTPSDSRVELALRIVNPQMSEANATNLAIAQPISSFTTSHPAGQPRVTNIHRIADLIRGQVVKPGETFSINDSVGKRTTSNGFVVDGVIENGKFAQDVGGGISQFTTTLFNAGFFGGLDFGEYQAHTIYITRYPYGREATVAFPHPDLQIKNTTPYGVLIWPTYTDTTLTVTLYSTPFATGEQTNQTTAPRGACTRVTTERTRKYVDGTTKIDNAYATYQPEEGKKC